MREIGRTSIVRNTINPSFNAEQNNRFTIHLNKESMLATCAIEIEVYDTDARGKTTDYLGHVRLQGETLFSLLDEHQQQSRKTLHGNVEHGEALALELEKSKRISDAENKHVKGTIYLKGSKQLLNGNGAVATSNVSAEIDHSGGAGAFNRVSDISTPGLEVLLHDLDPIAPAVKSFGLYLSHLNLSSEILDSFIEKKHPVKGLFAGGGGGATRSFLFVVYLNRQEISRFLFPIRPQVLPQACSRTESSSSSSYYRLDPSLPIECRLPERFPVGLSELQFALFLCLPKSRPELLAKTRISGPELKRLLREGLHFSSSSSSTAKKNGVIAPLREVDLPIVSEDYYHSLNQYYTSQAPSSLGQLAFYPHLWRPSPLRYKLIIRSGRNLPKADLFGKR